MGLAAGGVLAHPTGSSDQPVEAGDGPGQVGTVPLVDEQAPQGAQIFTCQVRQQGNRG